MKNSRKQNRALVALTMLYSAALGVRAQLHGQGGFYLLSKLKRTCAHEWGQAVQEEKQWLREGPIRAGGTGRLGASPASGQDRFSSCEGLSTRRVAKTTSSLPKTSKILSLP